MKKLFPLLLSYALMATQCYAISGGPGTVNGNSGSVDVVGAYSGVIIGTTQLDSSTDPSIPGDATGISVGGATTSSALGLFDLTVPGVSTATGAFLLFASGQVYTGTISASADPDTGKLQGVLQGADNFSVSTEDGTGAVVQVPISATADGLINANIRATASSSNTTARLTGTAVLEISFGGVNPNTFAPIISQTINFNVSGFQQTTASTAASTVSTIGSLTGANGAGGAGG